jgi:cyclophilin family peptidyl-prolyl cis-trans isomerase
MNCCRLSGIALLLLATSFASVASLPIFNTASAADPPAVTAADYPKLHQQWKKYLARYLQIRQQYQTDASADKPALQAEFEKLGEQVQELMPSLVAAAEMAYVAAPNKDKELNEFILASLGDYLASDNYEKAADLAHVLVDNKLEHTHLDLLAGIAFFNTNDFIAAKKHLQAAKDKNAINQDGQRYLESVDKYQEMWAKEQKIREAEEKAGDLPKVKFQTSQGDIVIALFENEAPNTVANFISLVEKGFYDGLSFHRVIPGFMAQGGDPNGDGSGGPGYTIPDEVKNANHREHFRGSLSMAKTAAPDSGGSQFFLCFVPTSHLDGLHTVFGRVIEGMDVVSKLQRTEGVPGKPEPDKIIKATVVSKRPHAYKPVTRPDK